MRRTQRWRSSWNVQYPITLANYRMQTNIQNGSQLGEIITLKKIWNTMLRCRNIERSFLASYNSKYQVRHSLIPYVYYIKSHPYTSVQAFSLIIQFYITRNDIHCQCCLGIELMTLALLVSCSTGGTAHMHVVLHIYSVIFYFTLHRR